jgi:hypothetical protein
MQAHTFDPFTRQLFRDAGLSSGMRVLDVGAEAAMWHFSLFNWLDQPGRS